MSVTIQVQDGKVVGSQFNEKLATRLCRYTSSLFAPVQFKGFWRITRIICKALNISQRQWVILPNGLKFSIDLADPYWNRMISPHFQYEPEMSHLLYAMKNMDYSFIDCGANIGYWSCLVASHEFGEKPVYSIEPLNDNYRLIRDHADRNQQHFHVFRNAISDENGQEVPLYKPGSHASVSIVSNDSNAKPEEVVKTITIDDIYKNSMGNAKNVFLKLDVEGVEIEALKGATHLLEKVQPLIIYEDHSDDKDSTISDYVLNELNYEVFYIDEQLDRHKIDNVTQINAIKQIPNHGYNFIAFHPDSDFAKQVMDKLGRI